MENLQVASQTATKVAAVGAKVVAGAGVRVPGSRPGSPRSPNPIPPRARPRPRAGASGTRGAAPGRPPRRDLTSGT